MYPILTGIPFIDGGLVALSCLRGKRVAELTEEDFQLGKKDLLKKAKDWVFRSRYALVFTENSALMRGTKYEKYLDSLLNASSNGDRRGVCPACGFRLTTVEVLHHQFPLLAGGESLNLQGECVPQRLCWSCAYIVQFLPLYLLPTYPPSFVHANEETMRLVWGWRQTYSKHEQAFDTPVYLKAYEALGELMAAFKSEGQMPSSFSIVSFLNKTRFKTKTIRITTMPSGYQSFLLRPEVTIHEIMGGVRGVKKKEAAWLLLHQENKEDKYRLLGILGYCDSQILAAFLEEVIGLTPEQIKEAEKIATILIKSGINPKAVREAYGRNGDFKSILMRSQEQWKGDLPDPVVVNGALEKDFRAFIYLIHSRMLGLVRRQQEAKAIQSGKKEV